MKKPAFTPQPFRQSWTLEDTRCLLDPDQPPDTKSSPDSLSLEEAIGGHLMHLADQGKLQTIPYVDHRKVSWASLWNTVASRSPLSDFYTDSPEQVAHELGSPFVGVPFYVHTFPDKDSIEAAHEKVVSAIETGTLPPFICHELYSFENGERYKMDVEAWAPRLGRWAPRPKGFIPLTEDAQSEKLEHLAVTFPTGELWVADWIRIPEFTEISKTWEGAADINSSGGRNQLTKNYAEHGLLSVYVGSGNKALVRQGDRLIVGDVDGDSADRPVGVSLQDIDIAYRWATMIDRQTLVDTLAQVMPVDEALNKVANYAKGEDPQCQFQKVVVPPGIHHLYFSDNTEVFAEGFKTSAVAFQGFSCPMFVLSAAEIQLDSTPAPSLARRVSRRR